MACVGDNQAGGRLGKIARPRLDNSTERFIKNGGVFKKKKAKDLFELKGNPQLNKESFTFSKDSKYPYFTRTVFNNGILGYVDYLDDAHLIKGNSLAVGMMGMQFFYMEHDFYAGQFTKTAFPRFEGFNEQIALWFISWFNKSSKKYLGVLVRDFENAFYETEIDVPYYREEIALVYIEERVRELEEERVRELEAYLQAAGFSDCSLSLAEKDKLFDIATGRDIIIGRTKEGAIPLISHQHDNNGISKRVSQIADRRLFNYETTIPLADRGVFLATTQAENFHIGTRVKALTFKNGKQSENVRLYFVTAINQLQVLFTEYLTNATDNLPNLQISVPVDDKGAIDFAFMEMYINAVKKENIARLKEFIEREHKAYLKVTQQVSENQEEQKELKITLIHPDYQPGRIPLYTLRAACGYFEDGQAPEEEGWIDASGLGFTPDQKRHFAVHAKGDSMLPKIKDGDICIFEWYNAGSRNGEIVLSQSREYDSEYGGKYTIKRYHSEKVVTEEGWQHSKVELQPLNLDFDPIELDEFGDYKTIGIFKCVL